MQSEATTRHTGRSLKSKSVETNRFSFSIAIKNTTIFVLVLKICFVRYNKSLSVTPLPLGKPGWMENLKSTRTALSRKHTLARTHTLAHLQTQKHSLWMCVSCCLSGVCLATENFGQNVGVVGAASTCRAIVCALQYLSRLNLPRIYIVHIFLFSNFFLQIFFLWCFSFFLAFLLIKQTVASGSQWRCHCSAGLISRYYLYTHTHTHIEIYIQIYLYI